MYADLEYDRVQFVGFIVEVVMKAPDASPPAGSVEMGMPILDRVVVHRPTTSGRLGLIS
jgi:hypothetical protein